MHGHFENKAYLHYIRIIAVYCESQEDCVNELMVKYQILGAKRA